MQTIRLEIETPRWSLPLLAPARYKGAKGGRASGKSHFFAEYAVQEMVEDPHLRFVCIREVQRSLKFSAKALIEAKIRKLGVQSLFKVLEREIRRVGGTGVMIFEGMQDHTADSIKSLEDFGRCWVEEAQSLSKRSLQLLTPTIRKHGSEIWFSWNPETPDAPVEKLFRDLAGESYPLTSGAASGDQWDGWAVVHVNFLDNPFVPNTSRTEAAQLHATDPDAYAWVWLGGYNLKSHAQILRGKWVVDEFEPAEDWDGPYHGLDFGFSVDPTAGTQTWVHDKTLYVRREAWEVGIETEHMPAFLMRRLPGVENYTLRADSARPETISHLRNHGLPKCIGVDKWQGSVKDGIEHLRSYARIVVHPDCTHTADEFRLYSYKVDKRSGDILPEPATGHDHIPDSIRYGLAPLIKQRRRAQRLGLPGTTSHSNV
jgi:phage terminase large subunit